MLSAKKSAEDALPRLLRAQTPGVRQRFGFDSPANSMDRQLTIAGADDRRNMEFHKMILNKELPYTIGGGIGQSRLCMYFLRKAHIGEVQASIWSDDMIKECRENNIFLL